MKQSCHSRIVAVLALVILTVGGATPAHTIEGTEPAASGTGLYMYFSGQPTALSWSVCGSTPTEEGCFGSGELGPFGNACGVIGSPASLVVADSDSLVGGNPGGNATLYIYRENITATPSAPLLKSIQLPVPGDPNVTCSLAATKNYIYFGTSKSLPWAINFVTGAVTRVGAFGTPTLSITATPAFAVVNQVSGNAVYDSNNDILSDGGGNYFLPSSGVWVP
jgi:hypothetical protein